MDLNRACWLIMGVSELGIDCGGEGSIRKHLALTWGALKINKWEPFNSALTNLKEDKS